MLVGKKFVVEPDIFLRYPGNRAFVMGEAARPASFGTLWLAVSVSLVIDLALLLLGLGVLPIQLPEAVQEWRWLLLLLGVTGIPATLFLARHFGRLQTQGDLLEARVTVAEIRPSPFRPKRKIQYIKIEFSTPDGGREAAIIRRSLRHPPLPAVGTQAAVLYAGRDRLQVL